MQELKTKTYETRLPTGVGILRPARQPGETASPGLRIAWTILDCTAKRREMLKADEPFAKASDAQADPRCRHRRAGVDASFSAKSSERISTFRPWLRDLETRAAHRGRGIAGLFVLTKCISWRQRRHLRQMDGAHRGRQAQG